jgi:hypothetical protein
MIGHWKSPSPELSRLGAEVTTCFVNQKNPILLIHKKKKKVVQVYRNLLNDEQWQHVSPYLSRSS